ncbi:hypothetical protein [Nocardia abscessus]|uniref:hypothetical protein n=1 Tax=Nocardia abscessus TaxID=120957 RepID=UPI002454A50C|nr:hypothetical protein [Nocardia abscessus]
MYIYGTMSDAIRIVGIYAKRMALQIGDEPTYFAVDEDWFDSFRLVAQWLEYNEDLTTDDLPEGRKVLEISCIFRPAVDREPNRFVERTIDAVLEEFFRDGGLARVRKSRYDSVGEFIGRAGRGRSRAVPEAVSGYAIELRSRSRGSVSVATRLPPAPNNPTNASTAIPSRPPPSPEKR